MHTPWYMQSIDLYISNTMHLSSYLKLLVNEILLDKNK